MPRGFDSSRDLARQPSRASWEIVPGTHTGSERVNYSLVGHGNVSDIVNSPSHPQFGTREEAHGYMERRGLTHYVPAPPIPPSDAGDVGWARKR